MLTFNFDRPITLCHGSGDGKTSACWMTAISLYSNKNWGDHPHCVAPTIQSFARSTNDNMTDEARGRLIGPHLFAPIGTARFNPTTGQYFEPIDIAERRALIALRFSFQDAWPTILEAFGTPELSSLASELRAVVLENRADCAKFEPLLRRVCSLLPTPSLADLAYATLAALAYATLATIAYATTATIAYATLATIAARTASYATDFASRASSTDPLAPRLMEAREAVFARSVQCVLEMCKVDCSAPIEPDLSGIERVRRVCAR